MNKSKFLKKSLAMLLALMLVFAMIPLSASATEGEYGSDPVVTVNTYPAALTGDTYAVTIKSNTTEVTLQGSPTVEAGEDAEVVFYDKDGEEIDTSATADLEKVATKTGDNEYTLDVKLEIPDEDSEAVEEIPYKLVVTFEKITQNGNPAISALKNIPEDVLASYEIDADIISIVTKFGAGVSGIIKSDGSNIVPAASTTTVVSASDSAVVMKAQDGTTKEYKVEITMRPGLESFEIEGQVGETKITTSPTTPYTTTVDITVPYGTDMSNLVPTFEVGEDIVDVTNYSRYDFANGVDAIDYKDIVGSNRNDNNTMLLWKTDVHPYSDDATKGGKGEAWFFVDLVITPAANTAADLESIKVDTSNTTPVTGSTVAVEMPKNYSFGDIEHPKKVDVIVKGSENAKVEVLGQDVDVETITDGTATLENVNITSKSFKIRVTSDEEGATANEYTINLSAATVADTKLYVQAKKANSDTIYEAEFDGTEGVLTLPYAAKADAEAKNYTLYFSASTGASIEIVTTAPNTIPVGSTEKLDYYYNQANMDERTFIVTNPTAGGDPEDNKTTYTLKLDFEDAKTERTLSSATLVNTNDVPKITADGTYDAVVGSAKNTAGETVKTLRVSVPFTFDDTKDVYAYDLGLSEGAIAFRYDTSVGVSQPTLVALDKKVKGAQTSATGIKVSTTAVDKDGILDTTKATIIYVMSEKGYVDTVAAGDGTKIYSDSTYLKKNATAYYVYGVRANPQTGADLKSIDSTLDENVEVSLNNKTIEITVPYSYVQKNNNNVQVPFTLNFVASSMATVYKNDASSEKLVSDQGNPDKTDATKFNVNLDSNNEPVLYIQNVTTGNIKQFFVQSEDGNTKTPYTVKVKVNEAEKGAQLLSVGASGVTGAIDSNRNIALTLPYGSTKYPVQLELEASKMATIYVGSYDKNKPTQNVYNPETGYDLNSDLPIIVVSENGQNHTEYTLKTTVAENFFDVANDQWYYDEVLKAAENKWVNGTKPGYFEPNGTMTRGDFALIIARIKNYNPALYTESAFPDVESTDYYSAAITYCKEMGYLGGENGYFNPKDPITREEMAKIICNAAGVEQVTDPTSPYADDAEIAEWAKGYVYGCQAAEIMMGDENANTFDARSNATRAEAAAVLVRAFA